MKGVELASLILSGIVLIVVPAVAFYIKATVLEMLRAQQDKDQAYRDKVNKHDQSLYGETGENGLRSDVRRLRDRVSGGPDNLTDKMQVILGEVNQLERAFTNFQRRRKNDEHDT